MPQEQRGMGDFQLNKTTLKERGSLPIFILSAPDVEPEYGFGMLGIPPRVPPAAALIVVMEVVQFFKVLAWCSMQGFLICPIYMGPFQFGLP